MNYHAVCILMTATMISVTDEYSCTSFHLIKYYLCNIMVCTALTLIITVKTEILEKIIENQNSTGYLTAVIIKFRLEV